LSRATRESEWIKLVASPAPIQPWFHEESDIMRTVWQHKRRLLSLIGLIVASIGQMASAEDKSESASTPAAAAAKDSSDRQADLETKFAKALSGATLEGSYTLHGPGADESKLRKEKYTLGDVKKLGGNMWMFPARIEYGGKDVTLPIPLPVEWAGDTPVIVVENVTLPGFGTVSARVLFFDGHYAGYWKHGDHSGNLFGTFRQPGEKPAAEVLKGLSAPSGVNPPAAKDPYK
jgi:hypothetical protein